MVTTTSGARIRGITRLDETTVRLGGVGDNWHMTWARDDRQYVSLCDGSGWPGMPQADYNSRMYVIEGDPPQPTFSFVPTYPDLINDWQTDQSSRYYNFGILAVDGCIYQFLSTPNRPFRQGDARFVGAKLIYSPDDGRTWRNQDGSTPVRWEAWGERTKHNMIFYEEPGEAFALITVLQMGRNYEQNRDGYVYLYAPNGNREGSMNQLVLARAPLAHLLDRRAYQFFAGCTARGDARWSPHIDERQVVLTFPAGWVNRLIHPYAWQPSVVYYAPLDVYLMANWGMGCNVNGEWFARPSYLGFWTAPQPWGPWTQVHEETAWTPAGDSAARAYQPQIAPRWIAADGSSFWLVWTDFQDVVGQGKPYYSFNAQRALVSV